ncbi:putative ribonuclease H-like domain-containing protein [Tanacetum coccineum]
MNKLVKGNLGRGLPLKLFEIDQTCVACQKGKQHRASCKSKTVSSINQPLHMLHMDLFGPTFVKSLLKKVYCLVVTDDYSRFSWVFFLATKDETSGILKSFITGVKNLIDQRVKAEAVNTTCYVQNRVLVSKPHNKTPYELFLGRKSALGFMRPFGCPVTILNTIDHLGKFDGKVDEGFFVGYSINRSGPNWLFDIDALTKTMNYKPVVAGNQSNGNAGTKAYDDASKARMETSSPDAGFKPSGDDEKKVTEEPGKEGGDPSKEDAKVMIKSRMIISTVNHALEDIIYSDDDEDADAESDMNNLDAFMSVSPIPTTRVHKDHPVEQIIRDLNSTPQTRIITKNLEEHGLFSSVQQRTNHKDFQNCLFACFLSKEEPKKVIHALKDPSWIEAMQDELLQFKLQKVWTLMDLPNGKRNLNCIRKLNLFLIFDFIF